MTHACEPAFVQEASKQMRGRLSCSQLQTGSRSCLDQLSSAFSSSEMGRRIAFMYTLVNHSLPALAGAYIPGGSFFCLRCTEAHGAGGQADNSIGTKGGRFESSCQSKSNLPAPPRPHLLLVWLRP